MSINLANQSAGSLIIVVQILIIQCTLDLLTSRALRARAPFLEVRSAIVSARGSERVARASESSTCFPCWKSNQVTLFWRELFRVRSCLKGLNLSKITFRLSYNGFKSRACFALTNQDFSFVFHQFQKIHVFAYNVVGL